MDSTNNVKALKSGVWYTATNFIMKGIGFITTPIFTRVLSHEEFGLYSNYASWLHTFTMFATLYLVSTFISARFDFEDDFDGYISSMLSLSTISVLLWLILVNLFPIWFSAVTGVELKYLNIMMLYLLFASAIDMFQTRERYYFEYKTSVFISLFLSVFSSALAVLLIMYTDNKLQGRIIGFAIPYFLVGLILYIVIFWRGKKININYWKYALPICLPFIPHLLSLTLLNSMDKIMITRICGPGQNALYSLAYSCGAVITILITSLNKAFAPWLGEQLHNNSFEMIKTVSIRYVSIFVFMTCGIMLIVPEFLLIMGGQSYREAIYAMPPIAFGCVCQFIYTMHVNIEQFKKKTIGMALASISAAGINFLLNSIFIPKYGYIAAAYTTLISFLWLMLIHMFLVFRIGYGNVYNLKFNMGIIVFLGIYTGIVHFLYSNPPVLRYIIILIHITIFVYLLSKNKNKVKLFFRLSDTRKPCPNGTKELTEQNRDS